MCGTWELRLRGDTLIRDPGRSPHKVPLVAGHGFDTGTSPTLGLFVQIARVQRVDQFRYDQQAAGGA